MYPSSTTRSANNRSDHCAWPAGGSPQLNAIRRASNAPSALRRYVGRRPCRRPSAASNPASTKRFFTRSTRRKLMRNTPAMASPVQRRSLNAPLSQFSKTNALITFSERCAPLRVIASSASRSDCSNVTVYRFIARPSPCSVNGDESITNHTTYHV